MSKYSSLSAEMKGEERNAGKAAKDGGESEGHIEGTRDGSTSKPSSQAERVTLEPTRFPSLSFISQNGVLSDRETSIKNSNLKSELIENHKSKKTSKESLFSTINNTTLNSVVSSANNTTVNTAPNGIHANNKTDTSKFNTASTSNLDTTVNSNATLSNNKMVSGSTIAGLNQNNSIVNPIQGIHRGSYTHSVNKSSSSNTLQSVYTDAYSTIDCDDMKSGNNTNYAFPTSYPGENDDLNSAYQHSLYSSIPDLQYHTRASQNGHTSAANGAKEECESFIYNDPNSVDIMSMTDHKLQKKISNGVTVFGNTNNNNNHTFSKENQQSNNNGIGNNEFDFLDNQSVSTILTSQDYVPDMQTYTSKSPIMKRQQYNINNPVSCHNIGNNNLSVSPTHSKVRQVSQKIFPNYNSNPANNMHNPGITNYSKINLNKPPKHPRTNSDSIYMDEYYDASLHPNEADEDDNDSSSMNKRIRNLDDDDESNDVDDHTGLTDAESMLAKPFKGHRQTRKAFSTMKGNRKERTRSSRKNTSTPYHDYGSINDRRPFDLPDDYNPYEETNFQGDNNSPHDYKSMYYRQSMVLNFLLMGIYAFIALIILFSFMKIFIMANFDNPLKTFEVESLRNLLINDEVLLVDIGAKAVNVNFESIVIWNMDLDVFMVTNESNLKESGRNKPGEDITILLGNTSKFLTPLTFKGIGSADTWSDVWKRWRNYQNAEAQKSAAQIKLYKPGKDFTYNKKHLTHEQWISMLNNDYKIILRGNLKYDLPLIWQDQFISIATEIELKPEQLMKLV